MNINFVIRGRLGNAIFRYMACVIMCKYYNGNYTINKHSGINITDNQFKMISDDILNHKSLPQFNTNNINMSDFYQHDKIYSMHKDYIIQFIKNNPDHYVLTDGINAGDRRFQKFYMNDIIKTPDNFTKKYKNVLHLRLEDFVYSNIEIKLDRILSLLEKLIENKSIESSLTIVFNKPQNDIEKNYINSICKLLKDNNIKIVLESNDILTDYYILKEAEILISSNSTICWCASFFSDKLKQLYFPNYKETINQTFKKPIKNTFFY